MTILAIGRSPRIPLNAYATESPKSPLHDGCGDVLIFMPPGMWVTSLPNVLETHDASWLLPYATALPPLECLSLP